jgi:hypothetical protein
VATREGYMPMLLLYCLAVLYYNVVITNSGNKRGLYANAAFVCLAMLYNVVITYSGNKRGLYVKAAAVLPGIVVQCCNYK